MRKWLRDGHTLRGEVGSGVGVSCLRDKYILYPKDKIMYVRISLKTHFKCSKGILVFVDNLNKSERREKGGENNVVFSIRKTPIKILPCGKTQCLVCFW